MVNLSGDVLDKAANKSEESPRKKKGRNLGGILGDRNQAAMEGAATQSNKQLLWDPKEIDLWHGQNRIFKPLNENSCADLIESFKESGQKFPAIARRTTDGSKHQFELICGKRRHWTAMHLGVKLLIEIRDVNDREAFLLQDIENKDREDITDYERAKDYASALKTYFNNNQVELASAIKMDTGNLSRLLKMAELPEDIVALYADIQELTVRQMKTYNKILKNKDTRGRVLAKAKELNDTKKTMNGTEVIKLLSDAATRLKAAVPKVAKVTIAKSKTTGAFNIRVVPGKDKESTLTTIKEELDKFVKSLEANLR